MTIYITGFINTTKQIQHEIGEICLSRQKVEETNFLNPKVLQLHENISNSILRLERLCQKQKCSPADLPNPSYAGYLWLRFLGEKKWLLSHLHGLKEFQDILEERENNFLPRFNSSTIHLEIKNFNYLFRCKQKSQITMLEINECFISAPREIKGILVQAALGGKRSKKNHLLKEYARTPEFKKISKALQTGSQINLVSHVGKFFNLEMMFESLNFQYFEGMLDRPRLIWSPRNSKRRLGYYHPESDAITISRSLDSKSIRPLLIEYILYHEMLHKYLGIRESNGRRYAHTREFKKAEKRFNNYTSAMEMMREFYR